MVKLNMKALALVICLLAVMVSAQAADKLTKLDKIALGGTGFSTGVINLAPGTTAARGIYFGNDVTLYRSAANTLKTDDSLVVTGTLTTGAISYTTLSTTGHTTLGDGAADNITITGTMTATPAATFVGGLTSTGTLAATNAATVGTTLTVTGATALNGAVTIGDAVGDVITITGTPTFAQTVTMSGAATVGTTLGVTGVTTLTGALVANGACTLGDAAGDAVTVNGTPTFAQDATFTNQIIANGNVTLGNASTDTITCTGRLIVRIVTDAGPMTATNGTQGEIVFETSTAELYICTVTGTPATWKACT